MSDTLTLVRYLLNPTVTMGVMRLDHELELCTLELPKLFGGVANVPDRTCIPAGRYPLQMLYSEVNRYPVPHVLGVPGRSAIEIHVGNTVRDIKGCAVVGEVADISCESVGRSRYAFNRLLEYFAMHNPTHIEVREYDW